VSRAITLFGCDSSLSGRGDRHRDAYRSDDSPGNIFPFRLCRVKIPLHLLLLVGLSTHAASASVTCLPIPGADQIWSQRSPRWIWIGETHGSNETPAAFGELVCDALSKGRRVTVALERPFGEQAALDGILSGKDLLSARKVLLKDQGWRTGMDGRASEAMLRLLIDLRDLHRQYPWLRVFAMEGPWTAAIGARDEAMGDALLSLKRDRPKDLIFILSGNVHSLQATLFGFKPAAMYLPPQELLSLEVTNDRGSESWTSTQNGCGAHPGGVSDKEKGRPFGVYLDPALAPVGKVDGILALGVPLTPSPPAAGDSIPLPECRTRFLSLHPSAKSTVGDAAIPPVKK
jgi:hypothetical protein